ncbi:MAG: hypothetical protein HQL29_02150 [Candidatus Omnitrophica bacterium]|nr:hypothetical protein [Candidatus Omnitrophota bacterium]
MKFDDKYFAKFKFTKEQVEKNLNNALRDLDIAKKDEFLDVKFSYTYTALLKSGITLISLNGRKVKSTRGHHVKIIEKLADLLADNDISALGNLMRSKRNADLYDGGIEVTSKECKEYINFVETVLDKVKWLVKDDL